jgi:hypothetical protein
VSEGEDRRLREFFRALHDEAEPPVPSYGSLVRPGGTRVAPRRRRRPGTALAGTLGLVLAALVLLLAVRWRGPRAPGGDEAMRLASEIGAWRAPTDFLLRTPGVEFLQSAPRFGTALEGMAGDRTDLIQEEVRP